MKKFISLCLIAFGFVAIAPAAMATCISNCGPVTPTPTTSPLSFSVGGTAMFNGFGASMFEGQDGFALVEKTGYSGVDINLGAAGDLCGINCTSGSFDFSGYAGEHVKASAGAFENRSGYAATAINQGGAAASAIMNINKPQ